MDLKLSCSSISQCCFQKNYKKCNHLLLYHSYSYLSRVTFIIMLKNWVVSYTFTNFWFFNCLSNKLLLDGLLVIELIICLTAIHVAVTPSAFRTSTRYASLEKGCHLRPRLCQWTLASSKMTLTSLLSSVPMQSTLTHLYFAKKQFEQKPLIPFQLTF